MALLGGGVGGAGNPVGGSFTGASFGLEYLGNHCFHYSGLFEGSVTETVVTNFKTTESAYIVGMLQLNAPVDDDNPTVGTETTASIKMNGTTVAILKATTGQADNAQGSVRQEMIFPPGSEVEVTVDSSADENDRFGSIVFTGTVYRDET